MNINLYNEKAKRLPKKLIIYSGKSLTEMHSVRKYCMRNSIPFCNLSCERYDLNLREIIEQHDEFDTDETNESNKQILIMAGLTNNAINNFLNYLNANFLYIPLKYVLTLNNQNQTVNEAIEKITSEHLEPNDNNKNTGRRKSKKSEKNED